ncbi:MAG: hypothetical protein JSS09_08755 [Verrucomicrobia bacterium]|nr:hypothetical protein [Verrucomicrobiota bacterium]
MKNKTPKPPIVSSDLWQELYKQAFLYESLKPWKILDEDQIFAFADPLSKQIGYCCILGKCEEFLGLSVYRGREGLEMYFQLKKREIDPKGIDILHKHDALVVEFTEDKKTLDKEDLLVMKSLKLPSKKSKTFPSFRSYMPGFKGWFLTEDEVKFFTLALRAAIYHLSNANPSDSERILDKMTCPLYLPHQVGTLISWQITEHALSPLPKKVIAPISLDSRKIDILKDTKLCHDTAWEASIINTANVLCDHARPYLAKICMLVHQETLLILHIKPAPLGSTPENFLCEELLFAIKKHKRIPGEIFFNDPHLQETLKPLMRALGIQGTLVDILPATLPAQESLLQYMQ